MTCVRVSVVEGEEEEREEEEGESASSVSTGDIIDGGGFGFSELISLLLDGYMSESTKTAVLYREALLIPLF